MPIPFILFSIVIGCFIGALFHVFAGGGRRKLLIYLLVSCAGFFAGHFLSLWEGWSLFRIGALEAGVASLFSFLFLVIAYVLEKINLRAKNDGV